MPYILPNAFFMLASKRILIVDDMAHVREELRRLLELTGKVLVVGMAGNGQEALHQAQALRPDVVLMDLEMPLLDGWQTTRLLKARGFVDRIVVLSIHVDNESAQRAYEAGADAIVPKGADLQTLIDALLGETNRPWVWETS